MKVEEILENYPLHLYVWNNDYTRLDEVLKAGKHNVEAMDARGCTPLMLAVRLGHIESVRVLLLHKANASATGSHFWSIAQEAVATGDSELVKLILLHRDGQRVHTQASSIAALLKKLESTPDFYVEMKWEFASWLPLFSKMCPNDVCSIWKKGSFVRVDTTLLGMSANNTWLKGHLSYIFRLTDKGVILEEVNHSQGVIYRHEMIHGHDHAGYLDQTQSDEIITRKLQTPMFVTYIDMGKIEFEKSKSGILALRGDKKEEVNGRECQIFTASNVQVVTLCRNEHLSEEDKKKLREGHSTGSTTGISANAFASFLTGVEQQAEELHKVNEGQQLIKPSSYNPDQIKPEEYFDPSLDLGLRDIGRPKEMTSRIKAYKAHMSLCRDFPLSLKDQIIPIIDLMSEYNPYFHRLKEFITMHLPSGFPIKIEIPLYHILNMRITFNNLLASEKAVKGVKYFANEAAETRSADIDAITVEKHGDKPTASSRCRIDDDVFQSPSAYRLQSENSPSHGGGYEEEDQMIQMALQQNLIEYGQLDPKTKKPYTEGKRKSLTTDAREYYGEEDAMLQRAIEASLYENVKKEDGTSNVGSLCTKAESMSLEEKKRLEEAEEKELQRILELSKNDT